MTEKTMDFPRRQVGQTDLMVPWLGLGTAPLTRARSDALAIETVQFALSQGVNFIDTAPLYGHGRAERLIGEALRGVPRDGYVLATKVGRVLDADGMPHFDFSSDGIRRSFDDSLRRLGLDRVDILHIHDPDDHQHQALTEAYPVLADLRQQGVIKAVGAGMNQWQMEEEFARSAAFDCFLLAGRYTLLEQAALDSFLPLCQERGISLFLGGVYNSGILAVGPRPGATYNYEPAPSAVLDRVREIEAICVRHTIPLRVAAARFPLAHPAVGALLIGAESPQEFADTIAGLRTPIPPALWADLHSAGLLHPSAPTPPA